MQLDFPLNPTVGQVYAAGEGAWSWDGIKWESAYSAQLYLPLKGGQMQGPLLLSGNAPSTAPLQAVPLQQLNSTVGLYLPLTGGALAGPGNLTVGGTLNAGGTTLSSLTVTGTGYTISTPNGAISAAGNVNVGGTLVVGGMSVYNDGSSRLYCNYNYRSPSLVADNSLIINGWTFYNPGDGWLYCNASFRAWDLQSSNNVSVPGSVIVNGLYIQNSSGWLYTNANFYSAGAVGVGGHTDIYWNNNGGWMYCPVGMWCSNINTGSIQCNGQAVQGVSALYTNGTNYGGWGCQYTWTGNGNWVSFQCTDALYAYNNTGLAGGVYWTYCDERMKWNFQPVTRDCLAAINAIELKSFDFSEGAPRQRRTNPKETQPEYFRWEDLPRIVKHIETGFIAQQLREIIPEAVPEPPEEGAYFSVDMRPMVATLIGAVQQLTARLEAVEGKT